MEGAATRKILAIAAIAASTLAPRAAAAGDTNGTRKPAKEPRKELFWLEAEAGSTDAHLQTLMIDEGQSGGMLMAPTALFRSSDASGASVGGGLGLRVSILTIGVRGRADLLGDYDLMTAGGELGLRIPIAFLEPHAELGAGWASITNVKDPGVGPGPTTHVTGFYARGGFGLDVRPLRALSIGGSISWSVLAVSPPGVTPAYLGEARAELARGATDEALARVRRAEGSAYGTTTTYLATLGLHY